MDIENTAPETNTAPDPPAFLAEEAKQEWQRLAPALYASGVLTPMDIAAFAAYCQAWADFGEARRQIEENGMLIRMPSGQVVENPFLSIQKRSSETFHKFAVEFGITPGSRTKPSKKQHAAAPPKSGGEPQPVRSRTVAEPPADDLDAFMRG